MQEHELLYMPSHWSKRYEAKELLSKYQEFCNKTTEQVRSSIECELDIPYGSSEKSKYDIYGSNLPKDSPIFLFIHGGYWIEFSKNEATFVVPNLVANGIKVILTNYDLCPNGDFGIFKWEHTSKIDFSEIPLLL